jgi:hypothetical protein
MTPALSVLVTVVIVGLSACASSPPRPSIPAPAAAAPAHEPLVDLRRLAVVTSGHSTFTMETAAVEFPREFAEVAKWHPKAALLAPLARAIQRGLNWLAEQGRSAAVTPQLIGLAPGPVVADAFARTLVATGRFDQVRTLEQEPPGEDRGQIDALVRITVPAWGIVRVREGKPDLMAAYADARAELVARPDGVVVWEHDEDVTHAERFPLQSFTSDGQLTRQQLTHVLERAGQRLANEFIYARSAGQ